MADQTQVSTTPADPLLTPQTVIALFGMTIVAGTVVAVFALGTAEVRSQTVGGVLAMGGMIVSFFFGSSKGSQQKDATIAAQAGATPTPSP